MSCMSKTLTCGFVVMLLRCRMSVCRLVSIAWLLVSLRPVRGRIAVGSGRLLAANLCFPSPVRQRLAPIRCLEVDYGCRQQLRRLQHVLHVSHMPSPPVIQLCGEATKSASPLA